MVSDRHLSWEHLRESRAKNDDIPWICIGDFNEILFATEMKGGNHPHWQMNNFREVVDECGLRDVEFKGYDFTFDNGQEDTDNRQSRLDRAMGNDKWFDMFPRAKLIHIHREWSDHAPIKVILQPRLERETRGGKLFRFEQTWELVEWKGISIGNILRDIHSKRRCLKRLNEGSQSARVISERKKIMKDITALLRQEDIFWRQRSRTLWLKYGDTNTKYFYQKVGQWKKKNHIAKLVDDNGGDQTGTLVVAGVAKEYFEHLF
ncbi:uncharacterized protein LOC141648656 [Silene latifolia]|uniref:uncharacterized protein LOC141648656 n=1 Tax=Silene latifolia TaxID=37657 RepID=UPI003D7842C0